VEPARVATSSASIATQTVPGSAPPCGSGPAARSTTLPTSAPNRRRAPAAISEAQASLTTPARRSSPARHRDVPLRLRRCTSRRADEVCGRPRDRCQPGSHSPAGEGLRARERPPGVPEQPSDRLLNSSSSTVNRASPSRARTS
jgi:hypothetical protein